MLVGVDAAVVLLQLQMVATVCSAGVYDIRWTGWDGYKFFFFQYCAGQRFIAALSHTGGQARKN